MANLNAAVKLDTVFHALSDPTRRTVLARLSLGQASVSNLAREHPMALPTFMRHLGVLEASGLIVTQKKGRVRTCQIRAEALDLAHEWIAGQRRAWNRKLDRLGKLLAQQEGQENGS